MPSGTDWTDNELEAAAEVYLWMLQQEQQGKPFSKTEVNQSLRQNALSNRTKASIEYRMQNISAVLQDLGHPRIRGYVPAKNVGEGVKARIRNALEAKGFKPSSDYQPTADEGELRKRVSKLRKAKISVMPTGQVAPAFVETTAKSFVRDPLVKAWVLQNAEGRCEACGANAPFIGDDGEPYLEVHHVQPLASAGSDTIQNAIASCANCHRRCHHGNDRTSFTSALYQRIPRLQKQ